MDVGGQFSPCLEILVNEVLVEIEDANVNK